MDNKKDFFNLIADKLGINSFWGFIVLIFILGLLGLGFRFGINYFYYKQSVSSGYTNAPLTRTGYISYQWVNFPETRPFMTVIVITCVIGALVIWWLFYRDN